MLDLAAAHGWRPRGTEPPATGATVDPLDYDRPLGQHVLEEDAVELSRILQAALETVPDEEVPLQGRDFGRENTLAVLRRARRGRARPDDAQGALDVLSGPPKVEARRLIRFLVGGGFSIHPSMPPDGARAVG